MRKCLGLQVGLTALALCFWGSTANAQQQEEPSRQERIRQHNERIRKIIEESQRRRDEQQKALQAQQPPAAPGQPATATPTPAPGAPGAPGAAVSATPPVAAQPGQPLPTGPVQNARVTPAAQPGAPHAAQAQAPQSPRSESRTIMMFHPIDSIVAVGERFKTDVVAETKEGEVDELSIYLKYPRHILNPLALNHSQLDPFVKDKIDYEFDPEQGTIYLHAKLIEPQRFGQKAVVSIVWEALEPTDGAVISYEFGEDKTTGLYLKGSNLLGTLPGAEDGVIKTMVQVTAPKTKTTITQLPDKGFLIGGTPQESGTDDRSEDLQFQLVPERSSVKAGQTFDVDVVLNNPDAVLIDRVRLYLQFNTDAVQVVDRDAGNVVKRGVNIYDASARAEFPFDYYRYNYADNEKGIIVYEVSASNSKVRGDGTIATIRLKALQEVPRTELVMVQNAAGLTPTSDVSYLAQSLLQKQPEESARALDGVTFKIQGSASAEETEVAEPINPFESELAQRMRNNGR